MRKNIEFSQAILDEVQRLEDISDEVAYAAQQAGLTDASETLAFARELEHIKSRTYEIQYAESKGTQFVPMSTEAGPYAETITYRVWDGVTMAKLVTNYFTDPPMVESFAKEKTARFFDMANMYGWSWRDIEMANANGKPLPERDARRARQGHDVALDEAVAYGVPGVGTYGLLNHPNATVVAPSLGGNWTTLTGEQILQELNDLVTQMEDNTLEIHRGDTLLMSTKARAILAHKFVNAASGQVTVLQAFQAQNPGIMVESWVRCKGAAASGTESRLVFYKKSNDVLEFEVGRYFTQLPAVNEGMSVKIPCVSRYAGLQLHIPACLFYSDLTSVN